jgi:hypothetical protein
MTRVAKMQTDTTYNVEMEGKGYTVTIMEDYGSTVVQWEIFDDESNLVTDAEVLEPIVYIIEAFRSDEALQLCQCSSK